MKKTVIKEWNEISVGDKFVDGSVVTQIHELHKSDCFKLTIKDLKFREHSIEVSQDHLLLVNLSLLTKRERKEIFDLYREYYIPIEEQMYILTDKELDDRTNSLITNALVNGYNEELEKIKQKNDISMMIQASDVIKSEPKIYNEDKNLIWLTALEINILHKNGFKLLMPYARLEDCEYIGVKECRCVSTDTGKYATDETGERHGKFNLKGYDFIHHNSVTIRNIIFHCVTHGIKIGLIDLKLTEFSPWKNHEHVLGVANSVREAAELLRISRSLMYKRNAELAKAGVVDLIDYKPKKITTRISVFGREYEDTEKCIIKDDSGEKEISMKELLQMLS